MTSTDINTAIELRRSGLSYKEIGKLITYSPGTVCKALRAAGDTTGRHKFMTIDDIKSAMELRRSGLSYRKISNMLGFGHETIRQKIMEAAS